MIVAKRHRRWSQIFESHNKIIISNNEIDDDVIRLINSKYRYVVTYDNVQFYETINRDTNLTKIDKKLVFNEKRKSFFDNDFVVETNRIVCNVAIEHQIRMKIEIESH